MSLTDRAVVSWRAVAGRAAADHGRGVRLLRGHRPGRSALAGGHAPARDRGLLPRHDRPVGVELDRPRGRPSARRIVRPLTWMRAAPGEHGYARPVEGLVVVVDLDAGEVVEVADHGVVPLPPQPGNYEEPWIFDAGQRAARRRRTATDVAPIEITQPEGPSFTVDGHAVSWQSWQLRIGFTPREGLVLHEVGYDGRPIVYRASLAEMYVPYGDPAPDPPVQERLRPGRVRRRLAGQLADPRAATASGTSSTSTASSTTRTAAPSPSRTPSACTRRTPGSPGSTPTSAPAPSRCGAGARLVISTIVTVGNYEYGYFWYLYNDGTIEYEVKLTGVISTGAIAPGEMPAHGTLVAPGLYGPHHQHFFCVRLDMTVDGTANTVVEVDSGAEPARPGRTRTATRGRRSTARCSPARPWRPARHRRGPGPVLEDREHRADVRARRPDRVRADAGRERAADVLAGRAVRAALGVHRAPAVGHRGRRDPALRRRRLPQPAPRRRRGCRPTCAGDRPLEGRTWWSGTRSAPTTSCARRTGR